MNEAGLGGTCDACCARALCTAEATAVAENKGRSQRDNADDLESIWLIWTRRPTAVVLFKVLHQWRALDRWGGGLIGGTPIFIPFPYSDRSLAGNKRGRNLLDYSVTLSLVVSMLKQD